MPPRPHFKSLACSEIERKFAVEAQGAVKLANPIPVNIDPEMQIPSRSVRSLNHARQATHSSIVGFEAIVFLAILGTLARGPVDLHPSAALLATLSVLFFALVQIRRRVVASPPRRVAEAPWCGLDGLDAGRLKIKSAGDQAS